MAPEVVDLPRTSFAEALELHRRGIPMYDHTVDIWSIGCVACAPGVASLPCAVDNGTPSYPPVPLQRRRASAAVSRVAPSCPPSPRSYEMLFGRSPFKRPSRAEIDRAICNDPVTFPGEPDRVSSDCREFILVRRGRRAPCAARGSSLVRWL